MPYPPQRHVKSRFAMLSLSSISAAFNAVVAARLLSYWHVLRWEADSEWEMPTGEWKIDGVKLVWSVLLFYFAAGTVISLVGIVGAWKRSPSLVGIYRNYSVADLCFSAFATVLLAFATFRSGARAAMCEELALQPDLLRELDLNDIGINPENCELMFERGVVVFVGLVAIILVVRLQFILTVTNYHQQILRQRSYSRDLHSDLTLCIPGSPLPYTDAIPIDDITPRRIYLLGPRANGDAAAPFASPSHAGLALGTADIKKSDLGGAIVYAPVPIESLSADEARELVSTGAWVASPQSSTFPEGTIPRWRHHRSHSRTKSASDTASSGRRSGDRQNATRPRSCSLGKQGRVALPVLPDEGLLPPYEISACHNVKS